jgi:hypothetical protein
MKERAIGATMLRAPRSSAIVGLKTEDVEKHPLDP